jgi:hypothetical protein
LLKHFCIQSLCKNFKLNEIFYLESIAIFPHILEYFCLFISDVFFFFLDQRPSKSFWIILRLVFFVLAIEFMEAVETALTVPILTSLHVDESYVIFQNNNI